MNSPDALQSLFIVFDPPSSISLLCLIKVGWFSLETLIVHNNYPYLCTAKLYELSIIEVFREGEMESKGTILIVDDEVGPRESLKMILSPAYHLVDARDGFEALKVIRERKIDLVTLDLRMPQMDGMVVLMAIKKFDPQVEVLIITGYATLANAVELVRLGACGYLVKPFQVPRLLDEVAKAIEKKKTVEQLNRQLKG